MKCDLRVISLLLIYYKPHCRKEKKKKDAKAKRKPLISTLRLFHCKNPRALCKDNTSTSLEVTEK